MSSQLDILALEPFYGGVRRVMLDALIHCSRHRWTLLKLPPRRMERRLSAAAHWFAEQLSRHWVGRVDILFTSEALNLADFYRLVPQLLKKPSVVYFHNNQLPEEDAAFDGPHDLVNLNSAAAATEIWFNSLFHLRSFLSKANALVRRHPELSGRNPLPEVTARAQIVPPPVGTHVLEHIEPDRPIERTRRTIFVETRDADNLMLNKALSIVQRRGEAFKLVTVGPVDEVDPALPRTTLPEIAHSEHIRAQLSAGVFLSTKVGAPVDHHAVRALLAGCWPLVPAHGVYRELLPERLHPSCLYDPDPELLSSRLQDAFHLEHATGYEEELMQILRNFDPVIACRVIDERLEQLAIAQSVGHDYRI